MFLKNQERYLNDYYSRHSGQKYRESDSKDWGMSDKKFDQMEAETKRYGKAPKGYVRSDEKIKENVCEVLWQHPEVDASDVEVSVEKGCVVLKGTAMSRFEKKMMESLIEQVLGVEDVVNLLTLATPMKDLNEEQLS